MSKNERAVLLRHPCVYEELLKEQRPVAPDVSFEVWDLTTNPKYMVNPVQELAEQLLPFKKLLKETQEIDTELIQELLNNVREDPTLPPGTVAVMYVDQERHASLLGLKDE